MVCVYFCYTFQCFFTIYIDIYSNLQNLFCFVLTFVIVSERWLHMFYLQGDSCPTGNQQNINDNEITLTLIVLFIKYD